MKRIIFWCRTPLIFNSEVSYLKILLHESSQQHIHKFQFFYLFIIYSQISEVREIFERKNKDTFDLTIRGVQNLILKLETHFEMSSSGATLWVFASLSLANELLSLMDCCGFCE